MSERKWIPIKTPREMVAERLAEEIRQLVHNYQGVIHGIDRDGHIDIEFKDMHSAAAFVGAKQWEARTGIIAMDMTNPFNGKVVISVQAWHS